MHIALQVGPNEAFLQNYLENLDMLRNLEFEANPEKMFPCY